MVAITLIPLIYFLLILYKFIILSVILSLLIYQLKTKKYDKKINVIFNKIKNNTKFNMPNLLVCSGSILIYFAILLLKGKISISHKAFLNWELLEYLFLFLFIYSLISSVKRDRLADDPSNHFWYGLLQILNLSVLLLGFFSLTFYTIFHLSKVFLSSKDAFELSKWMIGLIGLGLSSFNIKLFVDYFRGAKKNDPYSLDQLKQLETLQNIQSNQEKSHIYVLSHKDIKKQVQKVKNKIPL